MWFLPYYEADDETRNNVPQIMGFRAVLMRGDNLRYYIKREPYEMVPYPDRPAFLKEIASDWCKQANLAFLPSVYLYDITNGERLDSYNCFFGQLNDKKKTTLAKLGTLILGPTSVAPSI